MRRFVTVVALLFFTIPFGISITGCGKKSVTVYCSSGDSGIATGQVTTISLGPKIYGISLNQAEISQASQRRSFESPDLEINSVGPLPFEPITDRYLMHPHSAASPDRARERGGRRPDASEPGLDVTPNIQYARRARRQVSGHR